MEFVLCDAVESDFDALALFLDLYLRRDYFIPHRQLREILGGRYHQVVFAIASEQIVGLAIMTRAHRTLVNLLVSPADRRCGIADALLTWLRVERIRVKTDVSDGDPTGYYLKRGYKLTSECSSKPHIRIAVVDLNSPPSWVGGPRDSRLPLFCDLTT